MTSLVPSFLDESSSFLQVIRTTSHSNSCELNEFDFFVTVSS